MKIKKKWLVSFLLGMILITSIAAAVIYAATQKNDSVHNKLSVPTIKGEIVETFTPNEPIAVGGTQTKDIIIENTGSTGFLVRVMVFPEIEHPSIDDGRLPASIGKEVLITVGTNWQYGEDGYYYYLGEVSALGTTTSLFNNISLADNLGTEYNGADFAIQVKSETVTAANYQYRKAWFNLGLTETPQAEPLVTIDTALATVVNS
ncbi:hypothetical protein [Enterococcus sp. HY326]|uniref:hypothetical protein n=1 Tax=Enterococcus sp. HY326 TaxID=2971265 RepID=UPI0022407091|nr:hypothetical protein [Enterococcus sp. HY326]